MTKSRVQVWSCGGGTQSAAIAALICQGRLRPDISVIVDTERECSSTWDYFESVLFPECAKVGVEIQRVKKSDFATVDLYGGEEGATLLIPAFTTLEGDVGKLPTYCSTEWKKRVVQRYCTEQTQGADAFSIWLGISLDEFDRMQFSAGKWEYAHPLVEAGMNRADCYALVQKMGWPPPPKSRCWMCPNQSQREWDDLRKNHPDDFVRAVGFEKEIQAKDKHAFLHGSGKPLQDAPEGHPDLFDRQCMSGMCMV